MAAIAATDLLLHPAASSSLSKPLPKSPFVSPCALKTAVSFSATNRGYSVNMITKRSGRRPSFVASDGVRHLKGSFLKAEGLRFAVVVARFNEVVTRLLLAGALETFTSYSVREEDIEVWWVPGSFEIPVLTQKLGKTGKYDAICCIGAVVRGDTTHYDAVANSAASGVLSASLNSEVPCIFGILTCDDLDQALNRAGGKAGNKGSEAALTAIEMASMFRDNFV